MKEKLIQYRKPLLAGGLLVLLLMLYFYRHKIFKKPFSPTAKTPAVNNSYSTSNTADKNMLQKGSKGEQVRQLQILLNEEHKKHTPTFIPLLVEDGVFGTKTEQMLVKYTNKSSITLDQFKTHLAKP